MIFHNFTSNHLALLFKGPLSWLNPGWQLSSTEPLTHSPPLGWGRELEG